MNGIFKRVLLVLLMVCVAASVLCACSDDVGDDDYMADYEGPTPALGNGDWNGIYRWSNPTNKTNGGKCTEIVFKVKEVALSDGSSAFEVWDYSDPSHERRMFPVDEPVDGKYRWHDWDEDSVVADNYRFNAGKFNTTSYEPKRWYVKSLGRNDLVGTCTVESVAQVLFEVSVTTKNSFTLRYNFRTETMELAFFMNGDGVASWGLFYNPAPGREGKKVFVLEKVE